MFDKYLPYWMTRGMLRAGVMMTGILFVISYTVDVTLAGFGVSAAATVLAMVRCRAGKAANVSATPVDGVPATPERAKPRANDRRCQATPGHVQPRLLQADATSGDTRPYSATVRSRLTSEGSLVRSQLRPPDKTSSAIM